MNKMNAFRRLLRPEVVLILLALGLAIAGFFPSDSKDVIDLHFHDTYILLGRSFLYFLMALPIALVSVIYFLTRNFRQWEFLQYLHIGCIIIFPYLLSLPYESKANSWLEATRFSWNFPAALWVFLLGSIVFLINLIAGFARGKKAND